MCNVANLHNCSFGWCIVILHGSHLQQRNLTTPSGRSPPGWAPHQPRQEWTDPMWWAGLGHRSRSLPAWYCDQPHHLLHVAGGANWWCGFLWTADSGSARRHGPPAPGCHRGVAGSPNRAPAAAPLCVLLQSGVCHPGYPVNLLGLCHGDLWHRCETLLGSCVHWAIVCRGLASSLLGNHCRGAWAAPRLHPCSGGICFQCPCHPAALPAVRSRLPSKQCRRSNPGREPAASCGRSDPCPGAASPSTTTVVPGSGQGSDFSFNRSWPWSGGLPSTFPAAAAAGCWGVVACAAVACPWTACGWPALQDYGPLAAAAPGGFGWRPLPYVRRSGGQLRRPCQGLPVGDRTKRHHSLRTLVAARSQAAGFHTEVEKPGLLPPRPEDGGAPEDGGRAGPGRRPADVWIGNWGLLGPAALDLAVTSGMRLGSLAQTAANGQHAVVEYEVKKCSHQNTLATCGAEGLQFLPLVAEACGGGWGPIALQTFKAIATAVAARSNEPAGVEYDRLLQCLSVALQRENARAVLRRVPG